MPLPENVTAGVQHYGAGWAGHAQTGGATTLEAWRAWNPDLAHLDPYRNTYGDAPYWLKAWNDERYHATAEAAFAAIVAIVEADVGAGRVPATCEAVA